MPFFINPYNFVRFDPALTQRQRDISIFGHGLDQGNTGKIDCKVIIKSPIFTPWNLRSMGIDLSQIEIEELENAKRQSRQQEKGVITPQKYASVRRNITDKEALKRLNDLTSKGYLFKTPKSAPDFVFYKRFSRDQNSIPLIPGSTVKGVIRSIAEAISSACFSMFSRDSRRYKVNLSYNIPDESKNEGCYLKDEGKGLCICCRLFGTSNKSVGEGQEGFGGKVFFSDIKIENKSLETRFLKDFALSSPKPHHESFYLDRYGNIRGRKFYYHRPLDEKAIKTPYFHGCDAIELLISGDLSFTVTYENLSDEELGLLLLSLKLDDTICHKIGLGKPLGLGTIEIEFDEKDFKNINMVDRYKGKKDNDNKGINYYIDKLKDDKDSFYADACEDLKAILSYPPINHRLPIRYPDRTNFFNCTADCTIKTCSHFGKPICEHPLPTAQEVKNNTKKLHD